MDTNVRRGDIYYADLSPVVGSEQGGVRPVLIVQNDTGNRHSPTVIAAAITSQLGKARLPTHIALAAQGSGLLCVKRRDVGDIEVRISLELLGNGVNNDQFFFLCHLFSPPSYLVSTDLESICKPGLIVVER